MSNILTGFNMQGNDPIDNRIVSPSKFETLEEYLQRVPIQKRYYGLSFYALDENNELRHYTFQTSLIEPTIDDDEEEIERLDKELQEHVNNKEIHKTSEEIRSEIVDADIPDTIARVQWTLDKIEEAVNTVMGDIVDGASDEYNTLKKIQDKIVELRTEMESQLYGDDGGEVLKTLEQALKFLNQYKDFIVSIPDNYVNKQDIVDNLNTDDPTKVLSARQGKVLSETLTNYFDSAMASIRAETNRATNAENRIEAKLDDEIDRSTAEDIRIQGELDAEENRAQSEEKRIENKLDAEITRSTTKDTELGNQIITESNRAKGEEKRIENKLDNEITRSTAKDKDHDNRIAALEGETHVQNTDIGTTSQTFQLQMGKPGNKIKNEDAAVSVRNAADTDYVNFIAKNATFKGDLIVEGQSFVTEAETVEIKDNILLLNKGEAGSGVTKGMAGLQIDRGTEPDFQILFVESDRRFKAGEEGNLQCLALRDDDGNMLDGMFTTWDSATHRLKTTNIIPNTRKLFFKDETYSLGLKSHLYGETFAAESLTYTDKYGSIFISAYSNNLNLDTDKPKFEFYKDIIIPSSISSDTGIIKLLNESGSSIAEFESSKAILNSSYLRLPNGYLSIKTNNDTKIYLDSGDADNHNLISSRNSDGDILSNFGYYGTYWGINSKKIATEEFANNKFLPLAGGTMTGHIILSNTKALYGKSKEGNDYNIAFISDSNTLTLGSALTTHISSSASDLIHLRNGTQYKIYDSYNFNPSNYLPLVGGNMSGVILMNNDIDIRAKDTDGNDRRLISLAGDNYICVGDLNNKLALFSVRGDLIHVRGYAEHKIWDSYNLGSPINYINGTYEKYTDVYDRNLDINGTQWTFLSATNAATTSIYAPTTAGTSGQVLTSTGGVPTWSNVSSVGDSRYVLKAGDTMTGNLSLPYLTSTQPVSGWTSKKVPNDYKPKSFYLEDDYNGGSGISNYGTVVTFSGRSIHWVSQMRFAGGDSTRLAVRTCNYDSESETLREFTDWEILANQEYVDSKVKNYLPLTGGTMSGSITIQGNTGQSLIVTANESSNYVNAVVYKKGNTSHAAMMGYHSTGGTNEGTGAIILVPYPTNVNAWSKIVGLYIAKNELVLDGKAIATQEYVNNRSVSWSNITGKPSTYTPSAHSHDRLRIEDNRNVTMLPNNMGSITLRTFFNANNMPTSDWYSGIHINGGTTDYAAWELCGPSSNNTITASSLYFRSGKDSTWNSWKKIAFTSDIPTIPSISISNSGSGNAVTAISASGHTLTVTKGATYLTSSSLSGYATQSWVTSQGYLTSSSLSGYATQTWVNNKNYAVRKSDNVLISHSNEFNFTDSSNTSIVINYRGGSGSYTSAAINNYTFYNGQKSKSGVKVEAETFVGALSGNATTATTASKLGSSTVGGTAKPIYLSSGTATACSATVGSSTVPVYMSSGTITQCSTTLGISITGNAATATTASNSNNLGGVAAATYVKSTSSTKVSDIQVVTTAGSTTGVLYVVLES